MRLKGVLCIKQKNFTEAIEYLNTYIEKRPYDYVVYNTLAMALEKFTGTDNIKNAFNFAKIAYRNFRHIFIHVMLKG